MLKFGQGNAKLKSKELTFSLPSGYTCPAALLCLSKADKTTGKITDGPHTQFRCFSASSEARYPGTRKMVWENFEQLRGKSKDEMIVLIQDSLAKKKFDKIRIHVGGDFFSEDYFLAWKNVAKLYSDKVFYAYSKRIDLLVRYGQRHDNFRVVASYGGKYDNLIDEHELISAKVVNSIAEADRLGLEIDHDDHCACECLDSFALLLHGVQPKGSTAAAAIKELKKTGWTGYGG